MEIFSYPYSELVRPPMLLMPFRARGVAAAIPALTMVIEANPQAHGETAFNVIEDIRDRFHRTYSTYINQSTLHLEKDIKL